MRITQTLLAVVLFACSTQSFAYRSDSSEFMEDLQEAAGEGVKESMSVYVVSVRADNNCCTAVIQMFASSTMPAKARFAVNDSIFDVTITTDGLTYKVSVLQTNINTKVIFSTEIKQRQGHSSYTPVANHSINVASARPSL